MNIDTTNGTLTVNQSVIPATLTLQEFLAVAMYQPHTKVLENDPFATYKISVELGRASGNTAGRRRAGLPFVFTRLSYS